MPIINPVRVLLKLLSTQIKYFQRQLTSVGKLYPGRQTTAKIQLLLNQLESVQPLDWLPMPIFNLLRVLPKPSSIPQKYFQRQLSSMGKVEPCKHKAAQFKLLWNQLTYPLGWVPMQIFNPMIVLLKPFSTPLKYFQRHLASMGKLEPREKTTAKPYLEIIPGFLGTWHVTKIFSLKRRDSWLFKCFRSKEFRRLNKC